MRSHKEQEGGSPVRGVLSIALAACAAALLLAAPAQAAFGLKSVDGVFLNADGSVDTEAGSHPYEMRGVLELNSEEVSTCPKARSATG